MHVLSTFQLKLEAWPKGQTLGEYATVVVVVAALVYVAYQLVGGQVVGLVSSVTALF